MSTTIDGAPRAVGNRRRHSIFLHSLIVLGLIVRPCQAFISSIKRQQQQQLSTSLQQLQRQQRFHRSLFLLEKRTDDEEQTTTRSPIPSATDSAVSFESLDLTKGADLLLQQQRQQSQQQANQEQSTSGSSVLPSDAAASAATRRLFFASTLIAAGTALGTTISNLPLSGTTKNNNDFYIPDSAWAADPSTIAYAGNPRESKLQWEVTPVNKRTGVTVYDAEQAGYNVRFVTYLSRFLLCFDLDCQRWWYNRAADIPRTATLEQVNAQRLSQFGAFSASVEVGLQGYRGPDGPAKLLRSLVKRYCPTMDDLKASREAAGLPPLSDSQETKQEKEIKEARRQIALLFSLMEKNQPVEEIRKLLAAIDNGSISSVRIENPGSGYAPGYGSPEVRFPPPDAGEGYETATGRAVLTPNGKILRVDVVNRGYGYTKPPVISISPPAALRFGNGEVDAEPAEAQAILFRSGVNKGRIERIQLTNPGKGYTKNEIIRIRFSPPDLTPQKGGITATATAVLEYEVSDIQIVNNGTGYAVDKPLDVYVEPPPLTARVNMNDPMMARIISPNEPLPATTIPTKEMLKRMPDPDDPTSLSAMIKAEAGRGGGGGCIGRACYDTPVVAVAFPRAKYDVFNAFRNEARTVQQLEALLDTKGPAAMQRYISGSNSGSEDGLPELPTLGGGPSSSSQLLSLLPSGVGLEFNGDEGRYVLAVDPNYKENQPRWMKDSFRLDPDFGPRGRSPIERDMELGISSYLRFVASGAICCSGVHLALTPIDVVKTKVQADPESYPGIIEAFKRVLAEGGPSSFFTGWAPTFVGFFIWGGLAYALTEYLRRTFTALAGANVGGLEVPIILGASALAAFVGSFAICPFEAVRIRSVAQPDYAPNILQVTNRMIKEEGIPSMFAAVPVFLVKEIPFAMAKFTVFDITTAWMYDQFPAAREDLQLSLVVSLLGGTMGGIAAAIVSNPADVTISTMKKAKTDMGPVAAATMLVENGGPGALFRGLPLRFVFYSIMISLQFLVYDAVRIALGIGTDDLKLYLDVLGGALSESGGPV